MAAPSAAARDGAQREHAQLARMRAVGLDDGDSRTKAVGRGSLSNTANRPWRDRLGPQAETASLPAAQRLGEAQARHVAQRQRAEHDARPAPQPARPATARPAAAPRHRRAATHPSQRCSAGAGTRAPRRRRVAVRCRRWSGSRQQRGAGRPAARALLARVTSTRRAAGSSPARLASACSGLSSTTRVGAMPAATMRRRAP